MKLKDINNSLLQRAIEIYLEIAYEGGNVSPDILLRSDFTRQESSWTCDQRLEIEQGLGSNRFFLRLGNKCYPHMKLGVVECAGKIGEFVFMADTHDRHFELVSNLPDLEEFKALQVENEVFKAKIEEAWESNGIPTALSLSAGLNSRSTRDKREVKSLTVLVVDDTPSMMLLEEKAFSRAGFNVRTASSGRMALDILRSEKIDLCVLDVMMPILNGYDVIRTLEAEELNTCPIILCTAAYEGNVKKEMASEYVAKPFSPGFLISKAKYLLGFC